jgi:hypothetical protein
VSWIFTYFSGAGYGLLVFVGEFFDAQDGDDVLQIFVPLQNGFYRARDVVMFFAHYARVENAREAS